VQGASCQVVSLDCTSVNAYATLVLAGAALLALLANVFLAWKTSQAARANIAMAKAAWPILDVEVTARSGSEQDLHGSVKYVSGTMPARDITLWLREVDRFFGPYSDTLHIAGSSKTLYVTPGTPGFWTRFHRLPKGVSGKPSWGIRYQLPDGKRIYRKHEGNA
jgi:hypothetical protein